MRWLFRTNYRSFYFLNATQFLGALNDNIFKLLVIYLLINIKGPAAANAVLSLAGAIFVIPFLIFSSGAGVLADRVSKRRIIVLSKCLELVVMLFGFATVYFEWQFGAYAALFMMATQSSIFGPSKYGIIPELVESKMMSKANGSMTSLTYLAIILGTFLASFITDVTDKNFRFEAGFCVFISIAGLLTSLGISRTDAKKSSKKINPFFLYEIYQTTKTAWKVPHLIPAIFGSAFFLLIGAFTQLNIIPFAMQSLHLDEVGGGYLFLATAVGIAIGAVLAGQISKDKVEPGISCIAGIFIPIFFFTLYFFSFSLTCTIISLTLLGIVGGGFLIPFDSFIQLNSPDEKRGQIIAAANFFSFIGVLLAAFCLYLISEELGFSAASGFALMGVLSLIANIILIGRLSSLCIPFFVQKILKRFRKLKLVSAPPSSSNLVILQSNSWWDAILLFSCLPKLQILLPVPYLRHFPWINGFVDSLHIIPPLPKTSAEIEEILEKIKRFKQNDASICLFFHRSQENLHIIKTYKKIFEKLNYQIVVAHGIKERIAKKFLFFRFIQKQITIHFTKG
jgi:acyl-[acyl-carrier-protein]-phospholipid O-acyltransferase/long-chain-fatty-acid--[acyl-carrier-protein] ligase